MDDPWLRLLIYLGPFLLIALIAKRWLARKSVNLSDVRAQAGPNRGRRWMFSVRGGGRKIDETRAPLPKPDEQAVNTHLDEPATFARGRGIARVYRLRCWVLMRTDSPVEGEGFEPSVPLESGRAERSNEPSCQPGKAVVSAAF